MWGDWHRLGHAIFYQDYQQPGAISGSPRRPVTLELAWQRTPKTRRELWISVFLCAV